jgi:uncharacterized protein with FMN-binding domain
MPNASPSEPARPGRVPRRGLAALVLTATAMALLFSFKTPSEVFMDDRAAVLVADVPATLRGDGGAVVSASLAGPSAAGSGPPAQPPPSDRRSSQPAKGPRRAGSLVKAPGSAIVADNGPGASPVPSPTAAAKPSVAVATPAPSTPAPLSAPVEQVVQGDVVRTPFGLVQVEMTLEGDTVRDVQALRLPSDRSYSAQISSVVEPILRDEALRAQSADIDLISGATYTSMGYAMSLQSALDLARASNHVPA